MQDKDFDAAATALRDFYLRSQRVLNRAMAGEGATFARARLLMLIAERGPLRSIDVATWFGHAPRTVTEAIDGLERDGLVRRDPDPDDRRAKRVSLTEEGIVAAERADRARRSHIADVFRVLDPAERDEIVRIIGRLNEKLVDMGG